MKQGDEVIVREGEFVLDCFYVAKNTAFKGIEKHFVMLPSGNITHYGDDDFLTEKQAKELQGF